MIRDMGRVRWLGGLVAIALLSLGPQTAAQVTYTDVTTSLGIDFVGTYGATLALDSDMSFESATQLEIIQRNTGNGAAVADYDNDGDLDLLLLGQLGHRNVLYRNDLPTGFVDVTEEAGVVNFGESRVAIFTDLDNDGWLDLVLGNDRRCSDSCAASGLATSSGSPGAPVVGPAGGLLVGAASATASVVGAPEAGSKIYRNNQDGTFTDVTDGSGFAPSGQIIGGIGLVDFDRDGKIDIFISTWGALQEEGFTYMEGHNRLYWNLGNFQFKDLTRVTGLGRLQSNSYAAIFADFDNDFDSDLYLPIDGYEDKFYRYQSGEYLEQTQQVGATHVGTDMGVAPVDFDNDGDLDLYITNVTDPGGVWGGNTLLVNQRFPTGQLSFVDEAAARGVKDTGWGWGTEWVDVDNDGDRDLFAVNGFDEFVTHTALPAGLNNRPAYLFLNNGSGFFSSSVGTGAEVVGDARAAIAFDMDRDGDQDLLITHVNAAPVLLESNLNDRGITKHWLDVSLVGSGTVARDGIGARIRVVVGATTYSHHVVGGGSFLSGRPFEAHFGLGTTTLVDEVHVDWPDGQITTLTSVAVDQHIVVSHP